MNSSTLEVLISKLGQPLTSALDGIDASGLVKADSPPDSDIYYFKDKEGVELAFLEGTDEFCQLNIPLAQLTPGKPNYSGQLPFALKAGATREEITAVLGEPKESGGPRKIPMLGETGGWDKFDLSAFPGILCITGYTPDSTLRQIRFVTEKHF